MKLVKLICIIGIFNRIIIWLWDDYMANEAYAGYLSSHILDTSRGLRGKNSQCESFLTDKEMITD